jgi:hypothetical protein
MSHSLNLPLVLFAALISLAPGVPARSAVAAPQPIDVYLIGGQSNATGQGYLKNLPHGFAPDPRVLLFHSGTPHLNGGATPYMWVPLRQASESPDRFGPELGFGNRLQELEPARRIALIKHAHSGTNLFAQWAPGADAGDQAHWGQQFAILVETVNAGLAALRTQGYAPVVRGMLWQQGESDADKDDANAANYGKNLAALIARIREQFRAPDLVFVYGYVMPPPNQRPGREGVRAGERDVDQDSASPLATRGAFVVATDDLDHRATDPGTRYPEDHLHFGTAGTFELGRRMAEKMHAALAPAK